MIKLSKKKNKINFDKKKRNLRKKMTSINLLNYLNRKLTKRNKKSLINCKII